jgi:hypothetical protein
MLGFACSSSSNEMINLVDNNGIEFKYALGDTTKFGGNSLIEINCIVSNNSDKKINYLHQTCNGLEYYIVFNSDSYEVMPMMNCNGTWAMISILKKGEKLEFNTHILKLKNSKPLEDIGLDFRALDNFVTLDTLQEHPEYIEKIYRAEADKNNIIWGIND